MEIKEIEKVISKYGLQEQVREWLAAITEIRKKLWSSLIKLLSQRNAMEISEIPKEKWRFLFLVEGLQLVTVRNCSRTVGVFFWKIYQKNQLSKLNLTAASDGLRNSNNYVLIFVLITVIV